MLIAPFAGRGSLLLFTAFLFAGALDLVALDLPEVLTLIWNGILSLVFFFQHSVMVRRRFRSLLSRLIPPYYLDAVYTMASSLALVLVVVLWQRSAVVLYEADETARWLSRAIFVAAMGGMAWGVFALKHFDPFGSGAIKDYLNGSPRQPQPFSVGGPYRRVRHPLYFFVLVMIWSCPDLTLDRLLFNTLWTVWIYMGTVLEERDLVAHFGDAYRDYQKKVPRLVPWKIRLFGSRC